MPLKPRIHVLDVDVGEKFKSKEAGEEKLALLKKNAEQIYANLEEIEMNHMTEEELKDALGEEHGDEDEKGSDHEEEKHEETAEEKVERKKAAWASRKAKYMKYADKGKVEKLEKANKKQQAKLEKVCSYATHGPLIPARTLTRGFILRCATQAVAKGKSPPYIAYKQAKVDFTNNMIKTAKIVQNLKKAGLMG